MSGVDIEGRELRKGATEAIAQLCRGARRHCSGASSRRSPNAFRGKAALRWPSPTAAALLGVIHLKDIVKGGMKERIGQLRAMGIRSVMITGDNPLTAAAIAGEAGVDDFLAQATPADKLELHQEGAGAKDGWWR